jgi:hypothetical protein
MTLQSNPPANSQQQLVGLLPSAAPPPPAAAAHRRRRRMANSSQYDARRRGDRQKEQPPPQEYGGNGYVQTRWGGEPSLPLKKSALFSFFLIFLEEEEANGRRGSGSCCAELASGWEPSSSVRPFSMCVLVDKKNKIKQTKKLTRFNAEIAAVQTNTGDFTAFKTSKG